MKWEFLGIQELPESHTPGRGYTYKASLWRTSVPGGWLVQTLNSKSSDPQPMVSFYPDPEHRWIGNAPPESNYLLRPAAGVIASAPDQLLRASSEDDDEPKRLEG